MSKNSFVSNKKTPFSPECLSEMNAGTCDNKNANNDNNDNNTLKAEYIYVYKYIIERRLNINKYSFNVRP